MPHKTVVLNKAAFVHQLSIRYQDIAQSIAWLVVSVAKIYWKIPIAMRIRIVA